MTENSSWYCRLEIFPRYFNLDKENLEQGKSWETENIDVYVEYFTDIDSLKARIVRLNRMWIEHPSWKDNKMEVDYYPGFMILNQWHQSTFAGLCPGGWLFLENSFKIYVRRYMMKTLAKEKRYFFYQEISKIGYDFDFSEVSAVYQIDFLPDKLINIEFQLFLEQTEITEEVQREVYYPEMVRRGYLDIINQG